ncbi:MAG: hypothetical protein O2877_01240 [bacterium]|nr:hypothetical protein [bacterium]
MTTSTQKDIQEKAQLLEEVREQYLILAEELREKHTREIEGLADLIVERKIEEVRKLLGLE